MTKSEKGPPDQERKTKAEFSITVITDPTRLIQLEFERVMFYLDKYPEYKEKGYAGILRFPDGICQ